MQKLYSLIPLLLCNFNLLAQSPSFTGQPSLVNGFVCYGSDAQISASTNSADVYQLQIQDGDSGTWSDYGGITGDATSGSILIVLSNYTLSNHFRIRITNNTSGDSNFSDVFFIDAQRPQLTIQPQNQVRCYGERVYFYVDNNATWTYTWERSNDGGGFGIFSGSKYQDRTTSSFNINTVNGADDNDAFRVRVTDANGCETISNAGLLSINNIGTIQPTTSTTFCEGEEATFSTSVKGTPDSYIWNFYDESSGVLTVSPFSVAAEQITLSKAPQGLDESELEVDFVSLVMNTDGSTSASTCTYSRSRTGYTTYDRPDPLAVSGDSICGPGDLTLYALDEICGIYEWYADTTGSSVASGPFAYDFTAIGLSATTNYYVRQIDCVTGCPSDFTTVEAKVNPLPSAVLGAVEAVCPDAISFSIPLTSLANADSFQVILTSGTLTGYTDASGYISGNSIDVPLPASKNSGNYGFDLKLFNTVTGCESTTSLSLIIKESTIINSALSPQTLCEGDILTISSDASGEGTLSYQWFFEGSIISGATGSSYSIPSVLIANAGGYHYTATGECGTATATSAAILVNPQTKINTQPQSQEVCLGSNATFSVSATGFGSLSYQWKKDGTDIGTDSPTLVLSAVTSADDGAEITCVVTGGCDDSTSAIAVLTVLSLPTSPVVADTGFCQNSTAGSLEALGLYTLNWYGMNATGGTASATAPIPSTAADGLFSYYVSQTDSKGCESERAKLNVTIDPELTSSLSSSSRDVCAFGNLNRTVLFTVTASRGTGSYFYQWGKNGSDLAGENSTEYTGTGSGNYFVNVTSGYCELNKDLTINTIASDLTPTPTATANGQAIPYAFCSGSAVALEATDEGGVTGTTLNWYANNSTNVVLQSGNPFEITSLTKDTVFYVSASATYGLMTCESDRTPVNLVLSPQPSAAADVVNETCVGAADGSVTLTPGTSFLPYSFQLDSGSPQATNVFDELASGTYTITLQDANGCTATQSVVVGENPPLSFDYGPDDQTNCKGNVVYFESQPSTDVPQQWYKKLPGGSWEAIDGETENRLRVGSIGNSANPAGTFYRTVIGTGVCAVSSDSAELFVNEFTANLDNQTACEGDIVTFQPPASTGDIIEYEWQKRIGTTGSWNAVQTGSSPDYVIASAAAADDDTYYRVKLTFFNPNETTCTETSDQGKLDVTVIDETTLSGSAEICEGEKTTLTASGCNGIVEWSDTQTGETIDVSPTSTATYTANCTLDGCSEAAVNSVTVTVKPGISAPVISASTTELCFGQTAELSLVGCSGDILWSTNETTATIVVNPISTIKYSATCTFDGCTSPPADSVEIFGNPELIAGAIEENTAINCAGYNPPTIQNATAHSGGKGVLTIQWEMSEDCSASPVVWSEIAGANGETFNPSTIYQTTCYRRKVTDECDAEVYSNIVAIEIFEDPSITVTSSADTVCSAELFTLTAQVTGGTGTCYTSWQQNLSSSSAGSSFWEDISGDTFTQAISGIENTTGSHISVYYRAIYDCELTNCNKATSSAEEVVIAPQLNVAVSASKTTICEGETITVSATGCLASLTWNTGETIASFDASPISSIWYVATCSAYGCDEVVKDSVEVIVNPGIAAPLIESTLTEICFGDSAILTATGCSGDLLWSTSETTTSITVKPVSAENYSVECQSDVCSSPAAEITITGYPVLEEGEISGVLDINCSGYNPPTIQNVTGPSGGNGVLTIQWEMSEDCSASPVVWSEISGANDETFNPSTIYQTTCYRRKVTDECDAEVYSNIVTIEIVEDPSITVTSSADTLCSAEPFTLTVDVSGGTGTCYTSWQRNLRSSAAVSSFWEDISGDELTNTITDAINSTTEPVSIYYRAIYDCELTNCNKATSEAVKVVILSSNEVTLNLTDTTICAGNPVELVASSCGGTLVWNDGFSEAKRIIIPAEDSDAVYTVTCSGICGSYSATSTINVIRGLPKPVNTTPSAAIQPDTLFFSATGTNLLWYSANHPDSLLSAAPYETEVGEYTYWVSQSDATCQSPRLEINSRVYPKLNINLQAYDQYDCEGNSVNFQIIAEGTGDLVYRWQRKRPGEADFTDLSDEDDGIKNSQQATLRVSAVGDKDNPHLSQYRCIVGDSVSIFYTNPRTLYANVVNRTLPNLDACVGQDFEIDLYGFLEIIGDIQGFQWQVRDEALDEWVDLADEGSVSGTQTSKLSFKNLQVWHSRKYRCRIFFNTGGFECIENTDQTSLTVGEYPQRPPDLSVEYCQGERTRTLSYNAKPQDDIWYLSNDDSDVGTNKAPKVSSDSAGTFLWYFAAESDEGCASSKAKYTITIHPEPQAPDNRTPAVVKEGDTLVFDASGENLIWYLTRTGKNFELNVPPTFTEVDFYDYYVSQTSEFGCESPRTYIAAEIRGNLGFTADVENLADCEGNSVRFRANQKGIPRFTFQWERKRSGENEFSLMEGETEDELLVSNIGSSSNPHLSEYRVILTDSTGESAVSNAATLFVNKVDGSIPDQTYCAGSGIKIDTSGLIVQGEIVLIELQKQVGRSWIAIAESENFNFINVLSDSLTEGDFRLRFTFAAEYGATCTRSSTVFSINLSEPPESPGAIDQTICQFGSLNLPVYRDLTYQWYDVEKEPIESEVLALESGDDHLFFYSWVNIAGCESTLDSVKLNVLKAPVLELQDTLFTFCRFATEEYLTLSDTADFNWYLDSLLTTPLDEAPLVETAESGTTFYWVTYTNKNGCGSLPVKVTVQVEECFLGARDEDCRELVIEEVSGNDWLYFHTVNGEIVFALHPKGQNFGRVVLNYRQTSSSEIETALGTVFLPRYFNLNCENEFTEPVLIRAYYQNQEIEDYLGRVEEGEFNGGLFQIVNYEGINEDCYFENNDNFEEGESWVIREDQDLLTQNDDFSYFEFALSSFSEIGFTSNPFAKLASFESAFQENSALIQWQKRDEVRPLGYFLEKSTNGEEWFNVSSFSSADPFELTDYLPLQNDSYYRLVYQDADGTRKIIGQLDFTNSSTETRCFNYPNPFVDYESVNLYMSNIEPVEISVLDISGKEYPVKIENESGLYQKIDFLSDMMEGVYILEILGNDEKTCRWKMIRQKRN
ncbi:T9SS type A sorting domain-containing protein [Jiulongibacter sediminis]|jgi:hypothetical protein|uniref:Ig-like domain-containing protein n=1 Tax=Jiulongibacter sediminis TaxID=1605367 RepID=UPI0026EAF013|nr:T9SS type A sorting domain-containing protein [Jiulongibacter sediminis]